MARRPLFFCLILFILLAAALPTASAVQEIEVEDSEYFSLDAPDGLCISGFDADHISPDFNYSTVMNSYGEIYTLNITGYKNWYGRWYFDISMLYPNGTTVNKSLSTTAIASRTCDISVQYALSNTEYYSDLEWANVDVYVGLLPLTASFTNPVSGDINSSLAGIFDDEYYYTRLKFSHITYTCDSPADLTIYCSTDEEFQDQVNEDITAYAKELAGNYFDWTWDAILSFVELIPYVGDDLVTAMLIASYIIDEVFFYFNLLFIEYVEATLLTLEFFIFSYAIINNKRRQPVNIVKAVVEYHMAAWSFIIGIALMAINLVLSIIVAVANCVLGLKPI
ncbi:hypothetical protein ACSAZL_06490 [Methanosarcina sp. T3]|uniref:hypothetical protein n=1 Tax=Methanosarcina sp. T3 TaxID=3439062 RepID=UPI003F86DD84